MASRYPQRANHTFHCADPPPPSTGRTLFWAILLLTIFQKTESLTWHATLITKSPSISTSSCKGGHRTHRGGRLFPTDAPRRGLSAQYATPSFDGWQAGDVDADLDRLEKGILKSRAQDELSRSVRLQCLDYMAQHRRPLLKLSRRAVAMSTLTLLWWWALRQSNRFVGYLCRALATVFSLHFWVGLVWLPVALLWLLSRSSRLLGGQGDDESVRTNPSTHRRPRFIPKWQDPFEYSSYQVARHILEHWVACVVSTLIFYPFVPRLWRHFTRLLVRQAVPVSWRIYEKMWFLLQRPRQARPLTWSTHVMQKVTRNLLFTPLTVSWELASLLHATRINGTVILGLYTFVLAMALALRRLPPPTERRRNTKRNSPLRIPVKGLIASGIGLYAVQWICCHRQQLETLYAALSVTRAANAQVVWTPHLVPDFRFIATGVACLPPTAYILARIRQWRLFYSHNASLASPEETFLRQANDDETGTNTWRYRYDWFEKPRSVGEVLRQVRQRLLYHLLLSGSVEEKLGREWSERNKRAFRESGKHISDRVRKDWEEKPEAYAVSRSLWKEAAMGKMAKVHEQGRVRMREKMDDPLGLALYLKYGIGLGLSFDSRKDFYESKKLTNRHLEARAIKSAIKRAREMQDPETENKILDDIADPVEREQKRKELRENTAKEMKRIAERLTDLVPTHPETMEPSVQQLEGLAYNRVSGNEYVPERGASNSMSLDQILGKLRSRSHISPSSSSQNDSVSDSFDIDTYLSKGDDSSTKKDPAGKAEETDTALYETLSYDSPDFEVEDNATNEPIRNDTSSSRDDSDVEFIEAWERLSGRGTSSDDDDDDDIFLC